MAPQKLHHAIGLRTRFETGVDQRQFTRDPSAPTRQASKSSSSSSVSITISCTWHGSQLLPGNSTCTLELGPTRPDRLRPPHLLLLLPLLLRPLSLEPDPPRRDVTYRAPRTPAAERLLVPTMQALRLTPTRQRIVPRSGDTRTRRRLAAAMAAMRNLPSSEPAERTERTERTGGEGTKTWDSGCMAKYVEAGSPARPKKSKNSATGFEGDFSRSADANLVLDSGYYIA